MLFFTTSLWLLLSLLAPGSSGDELDGPYGYGGDAEMGAPSSPLANDVGEASADEVESLMGGKESGQNLLGRLNALLEKRGYGHGGHASLTDVISDLCQVTPRLGRIFEVHSPAGHYKYDLDEAKHACEQQGATLASYHQPYEAWQDGLEMCKCGWLSDGTARYPMHTKKYQCGTIGINKCTWQATYDAWCFRKLSICG
ncbi:hyaluronan and proteoglycan link protein 1-like [Branchiostoma floridae x Branchiostoma belcheri]